MKTKCPDDADRMMSMMLKIVRSVLFTFSASSGCYGILENVQSLM